MDDRLQKNLIQRVAVGDIFRRRATISPKSTALIEKRGTESIITTFRQLNDQMNRFARALREIGLEQGDRVGILGLNATEYVISLYGCAKGGFVAVPINPGMNPKDIVYVLNHSKVKILVVDDILYPLVNAIKSNLAQVSHYISIPATSQPNAPGFIPFDDFIKGHLEQEIEDVIIEDRDTFEILYTSGTTSRPKGVKVSHLSVFIASLTAAIEFELSPGFVSTMVLPIFHCAQQTLSNATLHMGGTATIFREFNPVSLLDTIEKEKINLIFCLPAMYRALLDYPGTQETNLESVKKCVYAMAPMDMRTLESCIKVFDADFMLGTGQTECFPPSNVFGSEWQLKKQGNYWGKSCLTLDTAIMDDRGCILENNEVGEIVWRGPVIMESYLDNPEATEESRKFGWHHSGDLGYFDDDGQLVFVDRKKDMIKTGGENVASIKVEQTLLEDQRVESAAVIGLPHERWIEGVTAFVIPQKGIEVSEEDIIKACKQNLGRFEVPKKIVFLDELPLTSTGKIRKNVLRKQYNEIYKG